MPDDNPQTLDPDQLARMLQIGMTAQPFGTAVVGGEVGPAPDIGPSGTRGPAYNAPWQPPNITQPPPPAPSTGPPDIGAPTPAQESPQTAPPIQTQQPT